MKKLLLFIIAGVVIVLLFFWVAANSTGRKSFDQRVTLKQKDKIPYGTSVARQLLPALFPGATIINENRAPGNWNDISSYGKNQAVFLVSRDFNADEYELSQLIKFAAEGNYVYIITRMVSEETQQLLGLTTVQNDLEAYQSQDETDSLWLSLVPPSYAADTSYVFPGRKFEGWLDSYSSSHTVVLGKNQQKQPNFIRLQAGEGAIFVHLAPMAFSNYFILHKNNIDYYNKALSVIPPTVEKIAWNEYYLVKPEAKPRKEKNKSLLEVLMRYPSFRYGLLTAFAVLLLYILMEMRRKQRMIPLHSRPQNASLDFVKTMGRLYLDKRDHRNLARKMSVYFLEHVRSQYKIPTHELNEEFIEVLHFKSGYPLEQIRSIVTFIQHLQMHEQVNENQLAAFHHQLEKFYQNT